MKIMSFKKILSFSAKPAKNFLNEIMTKLKLKIENVKKRAFTVLSRISAGISARISHKYILFLKISLCSFTAMALVFPLTFGEDSTPVPEDMSKPPVVHPNSVRGVKHRANDGDYALLRGKFTSQKAPELFSFTDDGRHFIDVKFDEGTVPYDFILNCNYLLWARMEKSFGHTPVLHAESLSPPLSPLKLQITVIPN